jgi:hypothetical protein
MTKNFCPNCGRGFEVQNVTVSGSRIIVALGSPVVIGLESANNEKSRPARLSNEYAQALKDLSENINQQLKDRQIQEQKVKSVNDSLNELAKEVQNIKTGKEGLGGRAAEQIDYVKQAQIEVKIVSLIQRILAVLPESSETAATFTPLAPFSKLIGKGIYQIVEAVARRMH